MTQHKKMPLAHVDRYIPPEEDLYPYLTDMTNRLRWFIGTEPAVISAHPYSNLGAYVWLEKSDRGGYRANMAICDQQYARNHFPHQAPCFDLTYILEHEMVTMKEVHECLLSPQWEQRLNSARTMQWLRNTVYEARQLWSPGSPGLHLSHLASQSAKTLRVAPIGADPFC